MFILGRKCSNLVFLKAMDMLFRDKCPLSQNRLLVGHGSFHTSVMYCILQPQMPALLSALTPTFYPCRQICSFCVSLSLPHSLDSTLFLPPYQMSISLKKEERRKLSRIIFASVTHVAKSRSCRLFAVSVCLSVCLSRV